MNLKKKVLYALVALASTTPVWAESWDYSESADKMTSKVTKTAIVRSAASLALAAPYSGKNNAFLLVRQTAGSAAEVLLLIDKGQMMCRSFSPCTIRVRFDDAQPVTFSGTGSSDHDPKVAFIQNAGKFISAASKAKTILVQTEIFQNGVPVMEFKVEEPLKWGAPPKTKSK